MKKELKIAIAIIAVIIVTLMIMFLNKKDSNQTGTSYKNEDKNVSEEMLDGKSEEAVKVTQDLISDIVDVAAENKDSKTTNATAPQTIEIIKPGSDASSSETIKAVVVSPGTNPIDIESGKVLTRTGDTAITNVEAGSQLAPQQSFPMDSKTVIIPNGAVKLDVKQTGFTPSEFTVSRGQLVTLYVTNVNDGPNYEIFMFDDPSLSAVAVAMRTDQTKSISFNAPSKAGEYTFYSAQLNHRELGAVGKMIVK